MNPRENVRSNMVDGAVRLLATEGVEGTSFKGVLVVAEAPRGSVYHHFPGGKSELLHAALDRVNERALGAMEASRGQSGFWSASWDFGELFSTTPGSALGAPSSPSLSPAPMETSSTTWAPSFERGQTTSPNSSSPVGCPRRRRTGWPR